MKKLRKISAIILSAAIALSALPTFTAFAEGQTQQEPVIANTADDFIYTVDAGTVTITGLKKTNAEKAEIPATIDGKPVTKIGKYAF